MVLRLLMNVALSSQGDFLVRLDLSHVIGDGEWFS